MKNLTNRTKLLLGIVALSLVVIVAGVAILGPTGMDLFGATTYSISPSAPTVGVGLTVSLTSNVAGKVVCTWTSSNTAVATVKGLANAAVVTGVGAGQATITQSCGTSQQTATVTVKAAPTITASRCDRAISWAYPITLSTGDASTTWSAPNSEVSLSATSGASVVVTLVDSSKTSVTVSASTPGSPTGTISLVANSMLRPDNKFTGSSIGVDYYANNSNLGTVAIATGCPAIATVTTTTNVLGFTVRGLSAGNTVIWFRSTGNQIYAYNWTIR